MADSETTREDETAATGEATSSESGSNQGAFESDSADGLDEPSAEELLLEDEEWPSAEEADDGDDRPFVGDDDGPPAEMEGGGVDEGSSDPVDMDKTAEMSPEDLGTDLDLAAIRKAAEREKGNKDIALDETAPADSKKAWDELEETESSQEEAGDGGSAFEVPEPTESRGADDAGDAADREETSGASSGEGFEEIDEEETDLDREAAMETVDLEDGAPSEPGPDEGDESAGSGAVEEGEAEEEVGVEKLEGEDAAESEGDEDEPLTLEEIVADVQGEEESGSLGDPPSIPETPDDVRGSRETPEEKLSFSSGEKVGGRFTVERYLGSSGGGVSYLCHEGTDGAPVVIKVLAMPAPSGDRLDWIRTQIRSSSAVRHPNLTDVLGMGTTEEGKVFVAMEFVEGDSLSRALTKQREKGREVGLSEAFHVLAHICEGMKAVHSEMVHGLLTPFNIYLTDTGALKIQNLGFGQISARYLHGEGKGPYRDSIYVAPEVTENPNNLGPAADMYSLGMIAGELLSGGGLPRQKGQAREVAVRIAEQYGEGVHQLVSTSLQELPAERTASPAEFRLGLNNAVDDAGVDPAQGIPEGGLRVQPAVDIHQQADSDLFDIPAPDEARGEVGEEADDRYLVRKDGLDYGPFTKDEVLEQLYDDEIDEDTSVLDRATQDRAPLGEQEPFVEEVEEYIPIREERKRKERERREEIERKVKQGGKAVLVLGIIAGAVVLAGMSYYYFTRPAPEKLEVDEAFVALDYEFLPPPKEFQTVAADEELLNQIFNPEAAEEEIAKKVEQARGSGGSAGGGGGGAEPSGGGSEEEEVSTVDMAESGGSKKRLTDNEINNIILSEFSALRGCIHKELDRDPSFNGVTVKFYVRPNGSTGGVTLQEKSYLQKPVGRCLVQEFRQMEFPAHSAVSNKGVTFPLRTKR